MIQSKLNHKRCYYERSKFCYLCGEYIQEKYRKPFETESTIYYFFTCYGFVPDLRHSFKGNGIHEQCRMNLSNAVNYNQRLKYSRPTIWKKPRFEHENCHICKTDFYFQKARKVKYPSRSSALKPQPTGSNEGMCYYHLKQMK